MHGGGEGSHESADPEQKETVALQGHLLMVVGDNIAKVWGLFAPKYVAAGAAPTPSSLL